MGYYDGFKNALENADNERQIGAYIKQNLWLISVLNEHSWNCVVPKAEFNIGGQYRADFIILSACSGYWNCVLIEMQSPKDRIFLKKGEPAKGLREALRQVQDWKMWIEANEGAFRQQLAKLAEGKPARCSNASVHTFAETELRDPYTVIRYTYKILIGRSEFLTQEANKRRSQYSGFVEIIAFDRLLDYAKKRDESDALIKNMQ